MTARRQTASETAFLRFALIPVNDRNANPFLAFDVPGRAKRRLPRRAPACGRRMSRLDAPENKGAGKRRGLPAQAAPNQNQAVNRFSQTWRRV